MNKYLCLTRAVLASTLFLAQTSLADTTITTPQVNQNIITSVAGNIIVFPSGQLAQNNNGKDAILVDAATTTNATITLITGNVVPPLINGAGSALYTTIPTGGNGVNIQNGATGFATVNIGTGTAINSIKSAILVDNTTATVNNTGIISGTLGGIIITPNGINSLVTNSGTITSTGAAPAIGPNLPSTMGAGLTLVNSGLIAPGPGVQDSITINNTFNSITNMAAGIIQTPIGNVPGDGIDLIGLVPVIGSISNSGIIQVVDLGSLGAGVRIDTVFLGSLTNNAGGVIQTLSTAGGGAAINISNTFTQISNQGTIQAVNAGPVAIGVFLPSSGFIFNSGIIQSVNTPAIDLGASITQINNAAGGLIQSGGPAVIKAEVPGISLVGGIVNSGNITNTVLGQNAIDLQFGGNNINVNVTQNAGTITGNVLLATAGGNVLNMNGGTIAGSITASSFNSNILNFNGGTVIGNVTLGNAGDMVFLAGSTLQQTLTTGLGVDTIIATGGTFNKLAGMGNNDTLNVNGTFTAGTIIGIPNITVNNAGTTFNAAQPITVLNGTLTINPGTTMVANAAVSGTGNIANAGTLQIGSGKTVNMGGPTVNSGNIMIFTQGVLKTQTYIQSGTYTPQVNGDGTVGLIQTAGFSKLLPGSFVTPFIGGNFIPAGRTFNVLKAAGPLTDNSTLGSPASQTVYFIKSGVGGVPCGGDSCVQVTSLRNSFLGFATTSAAVGVAQELDFLAIPPGPTNPDLRKLLGQLDLAANPSQLENDLVSLAPVVNYAQAAASRIPIEAAFRSVQRRLEDLRGLTALGSESYRLTRDDTTGGYNSGDIYCALCGGLWHENLQSKPQKQIGIWAEGYGVGLNQTLRHQVEGYVATAGGVAIGVDAGDLSTAAMGLVASYTNTHVKGETSNHNILNLISYQGTIYGWFTPMESVYLDTMLAICANNYQSRRNINIGDVHVSPIASYLGVTYGAQADLGYAFIYDNLLVAPLARARYTRVEVSAYSERNGGGLDLNVKNEGLNQFILGGGFRVATKKGSEVVMYVPEFSAMILYDMLAEPEQVVTNFLGGGGAFLTQGISPAHTSYLLGFGVDAISNDNWSCALKYELQIASHFIGNAGHFQLRYNWDV
ncbi:MAG: autotransporter domain-containing protein [Candidatus Berkiellales bacterium]